MKRQTAVELANRVEAERLYPVLGSCENCWKPALDRHHKDGNTANNIRENIAFLCRRCHMAEDGRLAAFIAIGQAPREPAPPTPCVQCGRLYKPLRKKLCSRCNDLRRYTLGIGTRAPELRRIYGRNKMRIYRAKRKVARQSMGHPEPCVNLP